MQSIGEPLFRSKQIFSALHQATFVENMSNLPKNLRERLQQDFDCSLPQIMQEVVSKDGTRKFLLSFHDGALVECVLLTQDYGKTVCVSTQVGCKMRCAFCASGECGFVRNLSAGEMLAQVLLTSFHAGDKRVTNIVLMGSGEPFDNYDNTIKFLQLVTHPDGINIGGRNISVSTAGLPDKIRAFADLKLQVNLCISLHAPNDTIRKQIMPIAKAHPLKDLISAAQYFFDKTHRRLIFEYSLIDNVNCEPQHAKELASLLKAQNFACHVNLINLNTNSPKSDLSDPQINVDVELCPPKREKSLAFMDTLIKSGISCTMRKSRGSDIAGACGQLRSKFLKD